MAKTIITGSIVFMTLFYQIALMYGTEITCIDMRFVLDDALEFA